MIKKIKYFAESILIYLFFFIIKIFGIKLSRFIFSNLFIKIGPLLRSNSIVKDNLKKFSNEISDKEVNSIISSVWSNYGKVFVEYMFLKKFRTNSDHIIIKNLSILEDVKNSEEPAIFVSGHFANFELMSMELTKKNIKLATIYRPLNNLFLNPLMEYLRKKFICPHQIKKGRLGVKDTIEYIKKSHSIALMIDQRVSEGEKIKFFNHDAFTTTLPAQIALKYKLKIIPIFLERKNDDKFEMVFYDPIDSKNFKDKSEISKKLNSVLEQMLVKNPNQWIWTHNRWKL
tara:strand:- start:13669 stop:14529 length:861 start_codon:yes stop_codon:yes gene_type:complete